MMNLVLIVLLVYVGVMLYLVRKTMQQVVQSTDKLAKDVRLASRTRVKQASLQSGPRTEEQNAKRLGKATISKRRVVGGDEDSELHTNLSRSL